MSPNKGHMSTLRGGSLGFDFQVRSSRSVMIVCDGSSGLAKAVEKPGGSAVRSGAKIKSRLLGSSFMWKLLRMLHPPRYGNKRAGDGFRFVGRQEQHHGGEVGRRDPALEIGLRHVATIGRGVDDRRQHRVDGDA